MTRLLLVGCGKMGGAMLTGWLQSASVEEVIVVEPAVAATAPFATARQVVLKKRMEEIPAAFRPDVVVFAVKPQGMEDVVPAYRHFVSPQTVFLSIAAGKPIAFFADRLGNEAAIVRAMPNTPAAIGRGMTVLCANSRTGAGQKSLCQALMDAVGATAWIDDERLMDAVTAVSGSGPAYVFLMIECLTAAGIDAGLPEALASQLAEATVAGAGDLAARSPDAPSVLRRNVTSPGGTTAAALDVLMGPEGLAPLLSRAVGAAERRSRELAG